MTLTAVLIPAEEGGFTAYNPETGSTTKGESVPETVSNLREPTELYLEEVPPQSVTLTPTRCFQKANWRVEQASGLWFLASRQKR